jgi:hypothetical protein
MKDEINKSSPKLGMVSKHYEKVVNGQRQLKAAQAKEKQYLFFFH